LLQTIARVNRPYFEKKAGLIVDYVGIFKFIEKAFKVYLDEDIEAIKKAIKDKKDSFEEFLKILEELKNLFGDLVGKFEKEIFDEALEILKNEEIGAKFINLYRSLRNWYEFLATDERMIKYLMDYKWITLLYEWYKKLIIPEIDREKFEKYFKKTIDLIHELTEVSKFERKIGPRLIDLNYIKSLKEIDLTEKQKTIGTAYALRYICVINQKNPIYKTIAEKVKEIIRRWEENEIDIIELKGEIEDILNYVEEKEKEKAKADLNEIEFGIKLILENNEKIKKDVEKIAKEIFDKIKRYIYKDWNKNPVILKDVGREIRNYLLVIKKNYNLSYEEFDELHQEIFEFLKYA
jgi:type I restriction enzyme R subunit